MRAVTLLVGILSLAGSAAEAQRVAFDRNAYRLHSIGQRLATSVRVTDASGRAVAKPAMVFRVLDPTVATVTPRGEVISRKEGLTRVWAISGRDSAYAFVMVEQRAARFAFSPAVLRLDALTARVPLRVNVSDSAGAPIAGNSSAVNSCRSLNESIVSLSDQGEVVAHANGATFIRCTDRGFADSVRVEVRQRATRATVGTKLVTKSVGDTFTVRLTAKDRQSQDVADARVTWVSLDPRTVSVDPTTGRALARAEGFTRVIAQLGDVADTANVTVGASRGGGLLQMAEPVVDTTPKAAALRPTLSVSTLTMYEGETRPLPFTVRDTAGVIIPNPQVRIRSGDTSTVAQTDSGLYGRKPGAVFVVVRYGSLVDSAAVTVRDKNDPSRYAASANGGANGGAGADFRPPTFDAPALAAQYKLRRDSALAAITTSAQFARPSGRVVAAAAYAGFAAHSSNQVNSATPQLIEDRAGVIYGGRATLKPVSWMALSGDLRVGSLTSAGTIGETMKMTEISGDIMFYLMPWLGLGGGFAARGEETAIAPQYWKIPRGIVTAKTNFVGDMISTTTSLFVLPAARFTGMDEDHKPDIGIGGEAGLEFRRGALDAAVLYQIERLSFPEISGVSRTDQFSSLRVRVGFRIGR